MAIGRLDIETPDDDDRNPESRASLLKCVLRANPLLDLKAVRDGANRPRRSDTTGTVRLERDRIVMHLTSDHIIGIESTPKLYVLSDPSLLRLSQEIRRLMRHNFTP